MDRLGFEPRTFIFGNQIDALRLRHRPAYVVTSRLIGPKLILRNLKLEDRKKTYSLIEIIRQLSTQVSSTSNSKPIVFLVSGTYPGIIGSW